MDDRSRQMSNSRELRQGLMRYQLGSHRPAPGRYGISDLPLDPRNLAGDDAEVEDDYASDKLRISNYYAGLAEFIGGCVTPMTVAVQGPWGSGKTSALFSVEKALAEMSPKRTEVFYINTWQYSVLESGETLVLSVLKRIISDFTFATQQAAANASDEEGKAVRRVRAAAAAATGLISTIAFNSAAQWAKTAGLSISSGDLRAAYDVAFGSTEEGGRDGAPVELSSADSILNLRFEFAEMVDAYCDLQRIEKVVFLIDDLDRLEPSRAVELMEVFKILFDVQKAVFVLAIDFDIVKLGVTQKYSSMAGQNGGRATDIDEWKARSFFDKIVQVPFNMPVATYDPTELLKDQLRKMSKESGSAAAEIPDDQVDAYASAARYSVGVNPRAIKRLFNAFTLTRIIAAQGMEADPNLFGIYLFICLEVAYPDAHAYVAKAIASADQDEAVAILQHLFYESNDLVDEEFADLHIPEPQQENFINFLQLMGEKFSVTGKRAVDLSSLQECLRLSSVTSVNATPTREAKSNPGFATVEEKLAARNFNDAEIADAMVVRFKDLLETDAVRFPQGVTVAPQSDPGTNWFYAYLGQVDHLDSAARRTAKTLARFYQNKRTLRIGFGKRTGAWDEVEEYLQSSGLPQKGPEAGDFGYKLDGKEHRFEIDGITKEISHENLERILDVLQMAYSKAR